MKSNRLTRRELLAEAPPLHLWPDVNTSVLIKQHMEIFEARKKSISMYMDNVALAVIQATTGINRTTIPSLVKNCLELNDDGRINGFRALIPYIRLKPYERKSPEKRKLPQAKGGQAGMLQQTLSRFPDLPEALQALILKERKKHTVHEHKIRPVTLWRIFLDELKRRGVQNTEWPFNTQYQGQRSIRQYMDEIQSAHFGRAVWVREESDARAHLAVGRGKTPLISYETPYAAVELDGHSIQAFFSVLFSTPEGTKVRVLLERLWLLVIAERNSTSILAASVLYSSEVTADDVLHLIKKAASHKWQQRELTIPGLEYPKVGGIPSGVISECHGAMWDCLLVDGHLSNLSRNVRELGRKGLGFAVNWGPVGHFERRPNVERFFKKIEDELYRRLPSTTGSNPGNGRARNAEEKAIQYQIDADELEEVLDVTIAQINGTPTEGLSFLSPLEYLRYYVEEKGDHFMIRHLPENRRNAENVLPVRMTCTVKGGRKSGRRPHINLDRGSYTNPVLADSGHLVGEKLLIEIIDEEDYRNVKAYLSNGAGLGILTVQGRWALSKHSRTTRKQINRLIARHILVVGELGDPVRAYFAYTASKHLADPKKTTPNRKDATTLAKIAKESGLPKEIPVRRIEQTPDAPISPLLTTESAIGQPMPDLRKLLKRKR